MKLVTQSLAAMGGGRWTGRGNKKEKCQRFGHLRGQWNAPARAIIALSGGPCAMAAGRALHHAKLPAFPAGGIGDAVAIAVLHGEHGARMGAPISRPRTASWCGQTVQSSNTPILRLFGPTVQAVGGVAAVRPRAEGVVGAQTAGGHAVEGGEEEGDGATGRPMQRGRHCARKSRGKNWGAERQKMEGAKHSV